MKRCCFFFGHIFAGAAAIAAFSTATMLLWNWLMPAVFGLTAIGFWQALGLLALGRILFGCMGGGHLWGRRRGYHNPIRERWLKMTPEEQKEFLRNRHFGHGFGWDCCSNDKSEKEA